MQILVVDDAPEMQEVLDMVLTAFGYQVTLANDGLEAWEILQKDKIQLVISDWMMPRMDGLELCSKVRGAGFPHYVYMILLTGRDDMESLVEGMDAGADDFLVKPLDRRELRVRLRAGERIVSLERKLGEQNRELSTAYDRMRKDLESAAAMQNSLLPPPANIQGVHFDWIFLPSAYVAGDMFGYFALDEYTVGFYLLDVSGHGVPSALLSFTLQKVMSSASGEGSVVKRACDNPPYYEIVSPPDVMTELNRRFLGDPDSMIYFTMVYGILDSRTGQITFTQAGHPQPVLLEKGKEAAMIGGGGVPVGLVPDMDYDPCTTTLHVGDRLFIYSDGITECANKEGVQFSEERLIDALAKTSDKPLPEVSLAVGNALSQWNGGEQYRDDVSMLVLERVEQNS